jgi:undecaprenyl-diphosphatase
VISVKLKWQLTRAFFISLICAFGFGLIALLISDQKIANFDNFIIRTVQSWESPALTTIMKFFTFVGAGLPAGVISLIAIIILYKFLDHRTELILFLWVVIGSALLNIGLKLLFQRARPVLHRIADANGFSFPSGHAMAAFSVYAVLAYLVWKHIRTGTGRALFLIFSIGMILLIGISRIYLGVHYPSDVLGGYLASGFWLAISIWFFQRNQERR